MEKKAITFSPERPLRWGAIGCGAVCEVKSLPAYRQTPGFRVDAVMGRQGDKVSDFAGRHGIPRWTTRAGELIGDPQLDAIYIATPPDSHAHYALQVAEAGKICCIEKPMASDHAQALEIYRAFADRALPLFVAYYRRSLPRFLKVKAWLDQGRIGRVERIHWTKTKPASALDLSGTYQWRTDVRVAPGGYFDDLGSHGLDLFAFLLGDIVQARGSADNRRGLYSAPDTVQGEWCHQSGIKGSGHWDFVAGKREDRVEIWGSRGSIHFAVLDEAPLVLDCMGVRETIGIPNPPHLQSYHVGKIAAHLSGDSPHPSTGHSALAAQWVMEQILKGTKQASIGNDHRTSV